MRHTQMRALVALFSIAVVPLTSAEVPPMGQAELDKAPVIFTGTVVSRQTSIGSVVYCNVVWSMPKTHTAQSSNDVIQSMQFDNSNSAISCLINHNVTLTLRITKTGEVKLVHGYYESWVTTEANSKLSFPPPPPQPPGHYGTFGIGAQVGDVLKVYEEINGNLWGPGGIQLVKAGKLTLQMWKSYDSGKSGR